MGTRREAKKTASKGRLESSRSKVVDKAKATTLRRSRTKSAGNNVQQKASKSTTSTPPKLVTVPFPGGFRPQKGQEMNERSAHLEKLKLLFESAPISRFLGMSLGYCENGVARVRLPFRKEFEEGHGIIHGGLIGLLADTAGSFAVGSMSPGSTVKTVEFKLSLLAGVQGDLLAIGEVVRKGRTLATCRLEVVEGNDRVVAIGLATYALQAV
jgi:uncharacterized protein (TIGR00369 family)